MGRVGNNATQQETIDDSFPPPGGTDQDHDLFPPSHQPPPPPPIIIQPRSKVPPTKTRPQNAPEEEDDDEEDLYHPNAHHYNPHDHEEAESFPPKNQNEEHEHAHAFPPKNQDQGYAHAFPPQNFYGHDQHQAQPIPPPNNYVGVGANNVPFPPHQRPVHIGHPVTPLNTTAAAAQFQPNRTWNSGLFDCMNDPENALITACFPCITFGQIAEIVDSGSTSCGTSGMLYGLIACCIAMPCIMSCTYRTKMRGRFGLIETPAPDWVVHCFCEWCALCQEYRQLKDMNLDPSIGWQGNVAMQQQNRQYAMTPPMGQRMM